MILTVHASGAVSFDIYQDALGHASARYGFMHVNHFLAHFGAILPLTSCALHVRASETE